MYKNWWRLPPNAVIGGQVCSFNEVGVTVDLRPCLWKMVAGVGGKFPSNRATELTNQINITLASDLGACFSGTAVPLACPCERSPLVSRCPRRANFLCPENTKHGPGWSATNHGQQQHVYLKSLLFPTSYLNPYLVCKNVKYHSNKKRKKNQRESNKEWRGSDICLVIHKHVLYLELLQLL